jgi:hypothetical protein
MGHPRTLAPKARCGRVVENSPPYQQHRHPRVVWAPTLQTFVPHVTIDRKIFKDTDGIWKYQIQESGYTNKIALP